MQDLLAILLDLQYTGDDVDEKLLDFLAGIQPAVAEAALREVRGGVTIRRVRSTGFGRRRTSGRLLDYASFHLLAAVRLLFAQRPDVLVTLTTPPLIGVVGALVCLLRRLPHGWKG